MQFILTEEEYTKLTQTREQIVRDLQREMDDQLQKKCTKICDTVPVYYGYTGDPDMSKKLVPWTCILTRKAEGYEYYCDECPVKSICPNKHKEFSK